MADVSCCAVGRQAVTDNIPAMTATMMRRLGFILGVILHRVAAVGNAGIQTALNWR